MAFECVGCGWCEVRLGVLGVTGRPKRVTTMGNTVNSVAALNLILWLLASRKKLYSLSKCLQPLRLIAETNDN